MSNKIIPHLGLGIGWRAELALAIERRSGLGFVEVMAEDFNPAAKELGALQTLIDRGVQVIPHGVTLSLGGAEPVDAERVRHLARLAQRFNSPFVSEHIAFVAPAVSKRGIYCLSRAREPR